MAINFPDSPTNGQTYTSGTMVWTYDGTKWVSAVAATTNIANGIASQIPYQTAANTTAFIPNGTAGQILTSNGTSVPTWSAAPAAGIETFLLMGA